jgi:hypothetical protein
LYCSDELWELAVLKQPSLLAQNYTRVSEKVKRAVVARDGRALFFFPHKDRTRELCELAVTQCGWVINGVPAALKTKDVIKMALRQDGMVINNLEENEQNDPELWKIAIQQNGKVLRTMPRVFIT